MHSVKLTGGEPPRQKEIYFDGVPVSELNVRSLKLRIGYVAQSTMLFSGKIIDNLKYVKQNASIEEVKWAAKTTGIHDFIENMSDKYNTVLEERGYNLSEGEKQRIATARAFLNKTDILILDEPTSFLDNIIENCIYQYLPEVVKEKTTFPIAHRFGTIKDADKIIMLRKNNFPLISTYRELFAKEEDCKIFFSDL